MHFAHLLQRGVMLHCIIHSVAETREIPV